MLSLDLEGPKTEVEKAIVELKKTFVVMDVRFPHKVELLDDYIWQRSRIFLKGVKRLVAFSYSYEPLNRLGFAESYKSSV